MLLIPPYKKHGEVNPKPVVTIVACVHGNEWFGLRVIEAYKDQLSQFPGLQLVIANQEAVAQNIRFMETDLNRSFPGNPEGKLEERLAIQLLEILRASDYVLDLHNTTSDILMAPIVTNMSEQTKRILNLCTPKEVAYIQENMRKTSLCGQLQGAVSLEFSFAYAQTAQAMEDIDLVVRGLLFGKSNEPKERDIFCVDGMIRSTTKIPPDTKDYHFIPELGVYPFLLNERAYVGFHAMSASNKFNESI